VQPAPRPIRSTSKTKCRRRPPFQRHPLPRIAPPAPAIISASRARGGSEYDRRCQILVIVQCSRRHDRFGARAKPSAGGGRHSMTTPMSSGDGECRVGGAAARYDHHRRRGAESSPPSDRHQQIIDAGCRRPVHCHTQRRTSCWRRSSTPQVDLACSSLSTGSPSAQRAMP
jgi:hypothetical protein